jgi:DNA-binding beta-propeller fold protein YncE
MGTKGFLVSCFAFVATAAGCGGPQCTGDLANRAYIVSKDSDEVHVIDLSCQEVVAVARTGGQSLHMLEVNGTLDRLYVDSSNTDETVVVDARTLEVVERIHTKRHPTHITATRDNKYFLVMSEADNMVLVIDQAANKIVREIPGFYLPHFARMSPDGKFAYIANLEAHHITKVDLQSLAIVDQIALDGFPVPTEAPNEGGFADVQIDQQTGILYGAHISTGRVLVYDTLQNKKLPELTVGKQPWIVYAEHPFQAVSGNHVVPSFADEQAAIVTPTSVLATLPVADDETYGVNYSPLVPDQAFVMNRNKQEIAVIDTTKMSLLDRIDVGGTTETASTTADGKYIVATVSSANRVVIIEAATHRIVKTFENLGHYPWSVTIPGGQNYCH